MTEWTPLDDLAVEEAVRADAPAALGRACQRAVSAFKGFARALDWDRFFDTEADIASVRELPEASSKPTETSDE